MHHTVLCVHASTAQATQAPPFPHTSLPVQGEYDLAGFAVGAVKKDAMIDGKSVKVGDVVLAFASSGVHSNGFSLVRKILEVSGTKLTDAAPWDASKTIGQCLLEPTIIYVPKVGAHGVQGRGGMWAVGAGGARGCRGQGVTGMVWGCCSFLVKAGGTGQGTKQLGAPWHLG